jgi:hypothetical protein
VPQYPVETFESQSYGLGFPQPYPFGVPEELPRNAFTNSAASTFVAFTGQGRVLTINASNASSTTSFVQVFNLASAPATGAVPFISVPLLTATAGTLTWTPSGRWFTSGCAVAMSSTQTSLTIAATGALIDVQYIPQVI